jgi:hypothetical protein
MLYAVTGHLIDEVFFLTFRPNDSRLEILDDVTLETPGILELASWPQGTERPRPILCRSTTNHKHFRVFKYERDARPAGFLPYEKRLNERVRTEAQWEAFARDSPELNDPRLPRAGGH